MLVLKNKRKHFAIPTGTACLNKQLERLPGENECFKFFSQGDISSICFINAIAAKTGIKQLYAATFSIGKKEVQALRMLSKKGRLGQAAFIFGCLMGNVNHRLYEMLEQVRLECGWRVDYKRSHAKVYLFDTDVGRFVLETSSNLNENPSNEQFSLENDKALFDFYKKNLFGEV